MLSNGSFSRFELTAEAFVKTGYGKMLASAYLIFAAIIVLTVGVSVLIRSLLKNRRAYISYCNTKNTFQYVLMIITVIFALWQFFNAEGVLSVVFAAVSLAVGVAGIIGLFLRLRSGAVLLTASLWLSLPLKEAFSLAAVYDDRASIDAYNAASKIAVFAADRMIIGRIIALTLIASVMTAVIVAYYTRRRYWFKTSFERSFAGVSKCPSCRSPIVTKGDFCPACGENIGSLPKSTLKWPPLDKAKYCTKCGGELEKNGDCIVCNPSETLKNTLKRIAGAEVKDLIKFAAACVLVVVVCLIPFFTGSTINGLTDGRSRINNSYVEKFDEWAEDPSVAEDANWLAEYEERSADLFKLDSRVFEVNYDRLNYNALYVFVNYVEASYMQMAVLQKTDEAVLERSAADAAELGSYFNETIDLQQQAILSPINLNVPLLKKAENIVLDALRFYISYIPGVVLGIALFAAGAAALVFGLIYTKRRPNETVFTYNAAEPETVSDDEKLANEEKHRLYVKRERITTLIGTAVAVLVLAVSIFAPTNGINSEPSYEGYVGDVYLSDSVELAEWFSVCRTSPEKAEADFGRIKKLAADCIDKLNVIVQNPYAGDDVTSVSKKLVNALNDLSEMLEKGIVPDSRFIDDVTALLKQGLKAEVDRLIVSVIKELEDALL